MRYNSLIHLVEVSHTNKFCLWGLETYSEFRISYLSIPWILVHGRYYYSQSLFIFFLFFVVVFFFFLLSVDLLTKSYELFPQKAPLCLTDSDVRICRQCLNILWTLCLREQKIIRDFKRPGASNILKVV